MRRERVAAIRKKKKKRQNTLSEISFDDNIFRAEDWYYAGPHDMFKNLVVWADDPHYPYILLTHNLGLLN